MAQIKARANAKGEPRYTAFIRLYSGAKVVHQESRTFPRRALAIGWAQTREVDLAKPGALDVAKMGDVAIGALIKRYVEEFEHTARWQRTKATSLKALQEMDIAKENALTLTSARAVRHVRERRAGGAGAATVLNDIVWLGVVLRAANAAWGLTANVRAIEEAREACRQLRLVAKSRERRRTPTYEELQQLDAYFEQQDLRSQIPMRHIMWFAIYSARRQEEITRLLWTDNDPERRIGIVRDAKHPTAKEGNHRAFRYTRPAWEIVEQRLRGVEGRIFPYNARSVGSRFTRACQVLGIEDLRFHDLRHEATTRLFESGLSIPDVAAHTLHESWGVLRRYTHLVRRPRQLHAPFLAAMTQHTGDTSGGTIA
ncbi:MAG TPA: tyrosine-type recombinase/integrase [Steroidobacteraceae bacterium]|jgi:integrase|nr:tyrosine-type recombinase/integrase [Steroidobacteraceae bacterium]